MIQIKIFFEGFLKQFGRASELSTENCVTRFKCFAYRRKEKLSEIKLYKMYRIFKSSKVAIFEIESVYKNTLIKSEKTKKE